MERRKLIIPELDEGLPTPRSAPVAGHGYNGIKPMLHNGDPIEVDDAATLAMMAVDDEPEDNLLEGLGALGPPPKYRQHHDKFARNMRLLGYTQKEIAEVFGVTEQAVKLWIQVHPSFAAAWEAGGDIADGKVARAMFKRAVGYKHPAVKIFYNRDTDRLTYAEYVEHYAPDTAAGTFWLGNRQKHLWKHVSSLALTGADGKDLPTTPPSINVMVIQSPRRQGPMIEGAVEAQPVGV